MEEEFELYKSLLETLRVLIELQVVNFVSNRPIQLVVGIPVPNQKINTIVSDGINTNHTKS